MSAKPACSRVTNSGLNRNKNDAALSLQYLFKPPRSEEGSLRDYVPQAGLGGSPRAPWVKKAVSEQNAKHSTIETGFAQNGVGLNAE